LLYNEAVIVTCRPNIKELLMDYNGFLNHTH